MEGQIEETVKEERNQRLLAVVNEICQAQHAELVGTTQRILCEGLSRYNDERLSGRTSQNRIVVFEGDVEKCIGQMLGIKITGTTGFTLYGEKMAQ
jgi:tRNA-2-methylthio-N6-dimethylallyladenosine synthase